jgi:hypothetical protein
LNQPGLKFSIDIDYSVHFGKNVKAEDVKHLHQHHYDSYPDLITFYALVKSDNIVRLLRFDLQNEYVLKAVEKTKVQRAGTFSQLLPATLKVTIHSVFKIEPNLMNMKPTSTFNKDYVVTFETEDRKSLLIKTINVDQKVIAHMNTITLPAEIQKVDISNNYPFYISIVDKTKKV